MDIGKEKPIIVVEPLVAPVPRKRDQPTPEPTPAKSPEREPEKV